MKVKLQYTVDLEEIPNEVRRLIDLAEEKITKVMTTMSELSGEFPSSGNKTGVLLEKVPLMREDMYHADMILSDCMSIMSSYDLALAQKISDEITLEGQEGEAHEE